MSRIAIMGDTHLLMSFHEKYDKFVEFSRFIEQVQADEPISIALLGDFVDKRQFLQGRLITWGEGSEYQIKIEKMIESTNINWYAMNGNHDDERVYPSIEKATPNFKVVAITKKGENGSNIEPVEIGNINAWFAPIPHDAAAQVTKEAFQELARRKSIFTKNTKPHVLFLHINMIHRGQDTGIDDDILDIVASNFDRVINAHEHVYGVHKKKKNVIYMPASFPTWVVKDRGFVKKYAFKDGTLQETSKFRNPFGYLLLDDETLEVEFKQFPPAMANVEVIYDVTSASISQVRGDWQTIAEDIHHELVASGKFNNMLILPVLTGTIEPAISFTFNNDVAAVFNAFTNIYVHAFVPDENLVQPSYSIDKLRNERLPTRETAFQNTKDQVADIVKKLGEKQIDVNPENIIDIISKIENIGTAFFIEKSKSLNAAKYIGGVIENILPELNRTFDSSIEMASIDPVLGLAMKAKSNKKGE